MRHLLRRTATLRGGLVLLAGAITLGLVTSFVLIDNHREYVDGQYEYWETFPLGETTWWAAWIATLVLAGTGIVALIAAGLRGERTETTTTPPPAPHEAPERWVAAVAAVVLVLAALCALAIGRFIQFDDTSGFGSDEWRMPWAVAGVLLAIVGAIVGMPSRRGRLALATTLGTLDVLLVVLATTSDGFRFIWSNDEGELFMLQVALAIVTVLLVATSAARPHRAAPTTRAATSQPALLADVFASTRRRAVALVLAAGYVAYGATLHEMQLDAFAIVALVLGGLCIVAALRAHGMRLQAVLWTLAAILVFFGSIDGLFILLLHALVALGVLVAWTRAGRSSARRARTAWHIVAVAGALLWAVMALLWLAMLALGGG